MEWLKYTLPETNSSHLKMDGWNTFSFPFGALNGPFSGDTLVLGKVTCGVLEGRWVVPFNRPRLCLALAARIWIGFTVCACASGSFFFLSYIRGTFPQTLEVSFDATLLNSFLHIFLDLFFRSI